MPSPGLGARLLAALTSPGASGLICGQDPGRGREQTEILQEQRNTTPPRPVIFLLWPIPVYHSFRRSQRDTSHRQTHRKGDTETPTEGEPHYRQALGRGAAQCLTLVPRQWQSTEQTREGSGPALGPQWFSS